jgi:hypothetical protein
MEPSCMNGTGLRRFRVRLKGMDDPGSSVWLKGCPNLFFTGCLLGLLNLYSKLYIEIGFRFFFQFDMARKNNKSNL